MGRNAIIYLIPNVFVRGLNFLLAPVLTRFLTPADYGIVGLASTLTMLFGILLGLAIHGAITRIHFECETAAERSVFYGTLLIFLLAGSGTAAVLIQLAGLAGAFQALRSVDFHPHLELALWTAYAQLFVSLRTSILQAREEARNVAQLNGAAVILQTSASLGLVVVLRWGASGVLAGQLVGQGLVGAYCAIQTAREARFVFSRPRILQALTFSLPLLPHIAANWGLSVSDRLVLERHVSSAELGVYSLGYIFCTLTSMVANSISDALSPAIVRTLRADPTDPSVPALGTLAVTAICWAATGASILGPDAIRLMTPSTYWAAAEVVPWVVLGAGLQGTYLVVSQGTWFSMKTRGVPVITTAAALINVALNLALVPRYGILAAAVNTAVAYGVMALMHDRLAHHLHPIRWEYKKWAMLAVIAAVTFGVSQCLPERMPIAAVVVIRVFIAFAAFPALVQVSRIVDFRQFVDLARTRAAGGV